MALVAEDFGLLILDIRMPDMSGFELAHLIKQRKKSASVPIIFLTAFYNEDQDVVAGYGTGAVDYLHKPVNATVLRSKVAVFVELHRKSRELAMANRALMLEVTERRRAEEQLRELNESLDRRVTERSEALRESEQRFRTMADQTPVMMWVTNAAGGVDFVNKEYCTFFGVTAEEALHSAWRLPVHDDDGSYLRTLFEALRTRRPFQAEARMRRADGEWRWLMSQGAPRTSASGDFLGMIVTSQDVTDQRHAATIQQQIARAKDEFIAVLAHELRSPLAPIRTSVGILRAHAAHPLVIRSGEVIERQTAHMARLLDDLLDTSRLSRNTLTLQRSRLRLGDVLQAAIEIASPLVEQQRLELVQSGHRRAGVAGRRPGAAHPGVRQPAQQRREVQQARRPGRRGGAARRGLGDGERARLRHRDLGRHARSGLRAVHPGHHRARPRAGRSRHRAVARPSSRRDARRRHPGGERRPRIRQRVHRQAAGVCR